MKARQAERIFHYCCGHSATIIREEMELQCAEVIINRDDPLKHAEHPQGFVIWLTDMPPPPHRDALGLTSHTLRCDRTTHCFEVEVDWSRIEWYLTFRKRHPEMHMLEGVPGVMPAHWYVGRGPIKVKQEVTW